MEFVVQHCSQVVEGFFFCGFSLASSPGLIFHNICHALSTESGLSDGGIATADAATVAKKMC